MATEEQLRAEGLSAAEIAAILGGTAAVGGLGFGASIAADTSRLNEGLANFNADVPRGPGAKPIPKFGPTAIIPGTPLYRERKQSKAAARDLLSNNKPVQAKAKELRELREAAVKANDLEIAEQQKRVNDLDARRNDPDLSNAERRNAADAYKTADADLKGMQSKAAADIDKRFGNLQGGVDDTRSELLRQYEAATQPAPKGKLAGRLKSGGKLTGVAALGVGAGMLVDFLADRKARSIIGDEGPDAAELTAAVDVAKAGGNLTDDQVSMLRGNLTAEVFDKMMELNSIAKDDPNVLADVETAVQDTLAVQRAGQMPDPDVNPEQLEAEAMSLLEQGDEEAAYAAFERAQDLRAAGEQPQPMAAPAAPEELQPIDASFDVVNDGTVGPTMQNAETPPEILELEDLAVRLEKDGQIEQAAEVRALIEEERVQQLSGDLVQQYGDEYNAGAPGIAGAFSPPIGRAIERMGEGQSPFGEGTTAATWSDYLEDTRQGLDMNLGDRFIEPIGGPEWLQNTWNFGGNVGTDLAFDAVNPESYVEGANAIGKGLYGAARATGIGPSDDFYNPPPAQRSSDGMAQDEMLAAQRAEEMARLNMEQPRSAGTGVDGLTLDDLLQLEASGNLGYGSVEEAAAAMGIDVPMSMDAAAAMGNEPPFPRAFDEAEYGRAMSEGPSMAGNQGPMGTNVVPPPELPRTAPALRAPGGLGDDLPQVDEPDLDEVRKYYIDQDDIASPRGQQDAVQQSEPAFGSAEASEATGDEAMPTQEEIDAMAAAATPDAGPVRFTPPAPAGSYSLGTGTTVERTENPGGTKGDFKGSKGAATAGLQEDAEQAEEELNWINRQFRDKLGMDANQRSDFARALISGGAAMANTPGNFLQGFTAGGAAGMATFDAEGDERKAAAAAAEQKMYDRQREASIDQRDNALAAARIADLQEQAASEERPDKIRQLEEITEYNETYRGLSPKEAYEDALKQVYGSAESLAGLFASLNKGQ